MGADFFGLWRLLRANRFRIRPAYAADCLIDVAFSLANTALKGLDACVSARRVERTELADDPIFIIGHWRTGTTLLHELLNLDPANRCATTYECFVPNHFLLTERWLKRWTGFTLPPHRPPDNVTMGWDRPQEDEFALCNMGIPSPYLTIAFPNRGPQYQNYLDLEDVSPRELRRWKRALRRFLKRLVFKRPGRLVLKSPAHTCRLPVLLDMFPKARFVYMVRDPLVVFPSTMHLWKSLFFSQGYQKPHYEGLEEHVFDTFSHMHRRLEATRTLVEPDRFCQLRYEDLVRDPTGPLRAIYAKFGLGAFDEVEPAIRQYAEHNAGYRTNRYETTPELRRQIARRWKPYIEQYGYGPAVGPTC